MIFADTSALFAVLSPTDHVHASARSAWVAAIHDRERIVTTNYVEVEATALLQKRYGMGAVRSLRDLLAACTVHWIGESMHATAVDLFLQHNRRKLSLVDCSSVAMMHSLSIERAFAYDKHFAEFGFTLV